MAERTLWAFVAGFVICGGACLCLVRVGARWPLRARRDGRGIGGPGLALGLLAGTAPVLPGIGIWTALGGGVIFLVGLLDDVFELSPWEKLLGQAVGAGFAVAGLSRLYPILSGGEWSAGILGWALSGAVIFFWVLALTNAVNLIDGLDGLAVGVLVPPIVALITVGWPGGAGPGLVAAVAALGALLGFAPANWRPARLLLGDSGAELLGYLLAVLAVRILRRGDASWAVFPALLLAAVPLGDTGFAILRRAARGQSVLRRDEDHIHHRLARRLGVQRAVLALSAGSLAAAALGVFLFWAGL